MTARTAPCPGWSRRCCYITSQRSRFSHTLVPWRGWSAFSRGRRSLCTQRSPSGPSRACGAGDASECVGTPGDLNRDHKFEALLAHLVGSLEQSIRTVQGWLSVPPSFPDVGAPLKVVTGIVILLRGASKYLIGSMKRAQEEETMMTETRTVAVIGMLVVWLAASGCSAPSQAPPAAAPDASAQTSVTRAE